MSYGRRCDPITSAYRFAAIDSFPCESNKTISSVKEFLNEIGYNHAAAAIQMNAVRVKAPTIHLGDLIGTFVQGQNTEGVTIKREESKACEGGPGDAKICASIAACIAI